MFAQINLNYSLTNACRYSTSSHFCSSNNIQIKRRAWNSFPIRFYPIHRISFRILFNPTDWILFRILFNPTDWILYRILFYPTEWILYPFVAARTGEATAPSAPAWPQTSVAAGAFRLGFAPWSSFVRSVKKHFVLYCGLWSVDKLHFIPSYEAEFSNTIILKPRICGII
jgi:AraC-like DNA-binding protein